MRNLPSHAAAADAEYRQSSPANLHKECETSQTCTPDTRQYRLVRSAHFNKETRTTADID
jgi:hypothetical protein